MNGRRAARSAAALLCMSVFWCPTETAHAGLHLPFAGANIETVQGFDREWRGIVTLTDGVRTGCRLRDDAGAWYVAAGGGRRPYSAVLGGIAVELGSGLVCGSGGRFFLDGWKRRPPRHHVRITPSLSFWDRQTGGGLSLETSAFGASVAVFRKPPGEGTGGTPWTALAACSGRSGALRVGAAVLARLEHDSAMVAATPARIPLVHLYSSVTSSGYFATGEIDIVGGMGVGMIEIGMASTVAGSVRLFRAPDWSDLGVWEDAVRNRHECLCGAIVHLEMKGRPVKPHFMLASTVRHERRRTLEERSFEAGITGRRRGFLEWKFDCTLAEEVETVPVPGRLPDGGGPSKHGEARIRTGVTFRGGPVTHTLRTDMTFDGGRMEPADASIGAALKIDMDRITAVVQCHTYRLRQGTPHALFRPGIGSFEQVGLVYGDGADVSARIGCEIAPGLHLFGYWGRPWTREARTYVSLRWKY
jgi:hypothetical protein